MLKAQRLLADIGLKHMKRVIGFRQKWPGVKTKFGDDEDRVLFALCFGDMDEFQPRFFKARRDFRLARAAAKFLQRDNIRRVSRDGFDDVASPPPAAL